MNTNLLEFFKKLGTASLVSAIIIPSLILLFQIAIVRLGLDGFGLGAVWWALIGTPLVYIALPWLVVAGFALFISATPGGRKPLETVTAYTMTLVTVGMYMTLINTFAMFVMGAVAERLAHLPGFLGLATAASIALGVWAIVFKAPPKWLARLSLWTFIVVVIMAMVEFVNPGSMRSFIGYSNVSSTVLKYQEEVAQSQEKHEEMIRAQIVLRGKSACGLTDPTSWIRKEKVAPGECAITPYELLIWNEGKNTSFQKISKELKPTFDSIKSKVDEVIGSDSQLDLPIGEWRDLPISPTGWTEFTINSETSFPVRVEIKGCVTQLFNHDGQKYTRNFSIADGEMDGGGVWANYPQGEDTIANGQPFGIGVLKLGTILYSSGESFGLSAGKSTIFVGVQNWYNIGTPKAQVCQGNVPKFRLVAEKGEMQ